jgi:type IV pilus assembly protein PilV
MQVKSRQRGVSLIEVLVAIVIFSVGVLGIALMQVKGAQYTKQSGARTVAVLQARSLAEAMRANPAGVYGVPNLSAIPSVGGSLAGSYYSYAGGTPPDGSGCGTNLPCVQAAKDLTAWVKQLQSGTATPGAGAVLATVQPNTTTTGTLTVTVTWNGTIPNSAGATNDMYQFDFQPSPPQQASLP